jgi:hypothetical protein
MKKTTILLAVTTILCSLALAGAVKIEMIAQPALATAEEGVHANANGFVIVNQTPDGAVDATVQIQLRDGAPEYTYVVKSAGVVLGELTTNKVGNGGCHINIANVTDEEDGLGAAVNIWTSDGTTARLLRAFLP